MQYHVQGLLHGIKLLYRMNKHKINWCGTTYNSVHVKSGVRQGCPLSPVLFVLCADPMLVKLQQEIKKDGIVRAFADDTALVTRNLLDHISGIYHVFELFRLASCMELNPLKCIIIPLGTLSKDLISNWLTCNLAPWKVMKIDACEKYLGFFVGPGATPEMNFADPVAKACARMTTWSLGLGLFLDIMVFNCIVRSVVSYIEQLFTMPQATRKLFDSKLYKLFK